VLTRSNRLCPAEKLRAIPAINSSRETRSAAPKRAADPHGIHCFNAIGEPLQRMSLPSLHVSRNERILALVFDPALAAMVAGEMDGGHCTVHVDLGSKRPVAGRVEKAGHELIASRLAVILDIVKPQVRAAAGAESAFGEGGRAIACDLARDGDGGGVSLEA